MKNLTPSKGSGISILLSLVFSLSLFTSCQSENPGQAPATGETLAEEATPLFAEQQKAFYLAWLADCTAGIAYSTTDSLQGLRVLTDTATQRMDGALKDPTLLSTFGNMGQKPVWGPVLKVSFPNSSAVLTDNLLYAVKSEANNTVTYSLGVAGTNEISYYGWFDEDFKVQNHKPWLDSKNNQHGSISEGSADGLQILLDFQSQNGQNIVDFLFQEISTGASGKKYKITVAGHSLGGALAPLLALRIKEHFVSSGNNSCSVEAWPFAGPTPGNAAFANYLTTTLDAYHAVNNTLDVVPHAWELDSLDRLCNMYIDLQDTCKEFSWSSKKEYQIVAGSVVSGVAQWAIGQSKSGGFKYQIAGSPALFTGGPMPADPSTCFSIYKTVEEVRFGEPKLYAKFMSVAKRCSGVNSETHFRNVEYFFWYMSELGYQHTVAYASHFFPTEKLASAVKKYIHGGSTSTVETYALPIIGSLLSQTEAYLVSQNITDCSCPK